MAIGVCDNERHIRDLMGSCQLREDDKPGIDVPFFSLESILAATDNLSDENKLGRGGFGPVYKVRIFIVIVGYFQQIFYSKSE